MINGLRLCNRKRSARPYQHWKRYFDVLALDYNCLCACAERHISAGAGAPAARARDRGTAGPRAALSEEELGGALQRQIVFFRTAEPPGTVVVFTSQRFLYVVQGNNRALRYGIGVGREGFQWAGLLKITRKAEWPDWTPPPEMIAAPAVSAALHGGWTGQSDGRARALSRQHDLSPSRNQSAADDRTRGFVRLFPPRERRHHRSLRADPGRHRRSSYATRPNCNVECEAIASSATHIEISHEAHLRSCSPCWSPPCRGDCRPRTRRP